ncbi:MAG: imidazolonepropionase [Bacteroidota bacterium]|nr:imidazolonepropionase [Bacteroidota bacterium]
MKLVVKNISLLVQAREKSVEKISGRDMAVVPIVEDAWLYCLNGDFNTWGKMADFEAAMQVVDPSGEAYLVDAGGGMVFPSWCDSHTHIVYAGPRETEFVDRIKGLSYEEIARRGGGILNSAKKLADTPEEKLLEDATMRLHEMIRFGTGAVEIKSGYGLSLEAELKMLRVIKQLKATAPIPIKATFLGAHAVPENFKSNRGGYMKLITDEMIPAIAAEGLADYCDVFCDRGFFTTDETNVILEAGWKHNLRPKIHANELDYSGGIQMGVKHNALSVDHLEFTGDDEIAILKNSATMPTLLPSTAFFLRLHYAPARKMIDAGLPIALATDFNPGSSPSGNMPFVLSLACIHMNMLPEEAINAATINSAYAMGLDSKMGSITPGKSASFFITKKAASLAIIPYSFGSNLVEQVFVAGEER